MASPRLHSRRVRQLESQNPAAGKLTGNDVGHGPDIPVERAAKGNERLRVVTVAPLRARREQPG